MISLPTAFLPNTHYLRLIAQREVSSIYIGEQYVKQSFRNRTELLTANGRESFTIPVQKIGYPSPPSSDILISEHGHWRQKLWQLLKSSYQSSPYWLHYSSSIEEQIFHQEVHLVAYNHLWLELLCKAWSIDLPPLTLESDSYLPEVIDPSYLNSLPHPPRYWQVWKERYGFVPHLSSLDMLLNLGPEARMYLLF